MIIIIVIFIYISISIAASLLYIPYTVEKVIRFEFVIYYATLEFPHKTDYSSNRNKEITFIELGVCMMPRASPVR